ncbi:MAG: response regulator transcription factor [wastewater metagenome]|nr:response regulator transcription factor [Candidatus Loosdrechtia aerotolerans]
MKKAKTTEKPSILIIDSDMKFSLSLSIRLENELTVITASNGKDGLSLFYAKPVSMILLDLVLSDMNGLEVLRKIREKCNSTEVLVAASSRCYEWAAACADLNIQGYVEKPVDPEGLAERIRKMIGAGDVMFLQSLWGKEYETRVALISYKIKKVMDYVHQNYCRDFSRNEVAKHVGLSPDHLSRLFHKESGRRLKDYVTAYRIFKSKELLTKRPDMRIIDIAASTGFSDDNYFSRFFKKYTGLTPGEFRRNSSL